MDAICVMLSVEVFVASTVSAGTDRSSSANGAIAARHSLASGWSTSSSRVLSDWTMSGPSGVTTGVSNAGRRADHRFRCFEANYASRGRIRINQASAGVLGGDSVRDAIQNDPTLRKFLRWSVMPQAVVKQGRCKATVTIGDATGHGAKAGTMVTVVKTLFAGYGVYRYLYARPRPPTAGCGS